jgi:hypothetical protein
VVPAVAVERHRAADLELLLVADEDESLAELQDERAQVLDQAAFQVALDHVRAKGKEVKL